MGSQSYVDIIPHRENFELWRSRLTSEQCDAICNEILGMTDGSEIHRAGWMSGNIPGIDLHRSLPAQPEGFGLFAWVVLQEHPDTWGFGRKGRSTDREHDLLPVGQSATPMIE